jgi:hypothetical protein
VQRSTPRYFPDRPLPRYAYVPGRQPHPVRDPRGHSHGVAEPADVHPGGNGFREEFLWGADLFSAGYYWEAHEAWERLWHACGRRGRDADLLKGLIKLAAAGVKAREGNAAGVTRHARRAAELLHSGSRPIGDDNDGTEAPCVAALLPLSPGELIAAAERIAADPPTDPPTDPDPRDAGKPVLPIRLAPPG